MGAGRNSGGAMKRYPLELVKRLQRIRWGRNGIMCLSPRVPLALVVPGSVLAMNCRNILGQNTACVLFSLLLLSGSLEVSCLAQGLLYREEVL
jgi:hypothetical protein